MSLKNRLQKSGKVVSKYIVKSTYTYEVEADNEEDAINLFFENIEGELTNESLKDIFVNNLIAIPAQNADGKSNVS